MKRKRRRDQINKHMQEYWEWELPQIQACIRESDVLSEHILKRMQERNISVLDLAAALMNGQIIEGFDTGDYPKYRNPDPIRNLKGYDTNGRELIIGVAIGFFKETNKLFVKKLTTVYYADHEEVHESA